MRKIFLSNKYMLIVFLVIFIMGVLFSAIYGRTGTHLFINSFHSDFADWIMKIWTWAGDGLVMLGVSVILLFRKVRYGLTLLSSFLLSSMVVQVLKNTVFRGMPRPVKYFEGSGIDLHLIQGLEYHLFNSFPSGHSATAFALFFGLAFLCKNRFLKTLFFIFATGTAFSRVYLSQHFLADAVFGALIGVLCAIVSHWYYCCLDKNWLNIPVHHVCK